MWRDRSVSEDSLREPVKQPNIVLKIAAAVAKRRKLKIVDNKSDTSITAVAQQFIFGGKGARKPEDGAGGCLSLYLNSLESIYA